MAYRKRTFRKRGRKLTTAYPYPYSGAAATASMLAKRGKKGSGRARGPGRVSFPAELARRRQRQAQTWQRRRKGEDFSGDYQQRSIASFSFGRRKTPTVRRLDRQIKNAQELNLYRWQGLKSFDDNGFYFCGSGADNTASPTYFTMPCYMFDLTSVQNMIGGAIVSPQPMKRAIWNAVTAGTITSGDITWQDQVGLSATGGSSAGTNFLIEKKGGGGVSTDFLPFEKSRLMWTDVKMNLWGAKNKSIKYIIQLVKLTNPDGDPWDYAYQDKHTALWQRELKHLVFNPIHSTGRGHGKPFIKVLKQFTKIIQPTASTENDADPHVLTLKMFNRWERDLNYNHSTEYIGGASSVLYDVDYVVDVNSSQNAVYTDTKSKIFLMIKAEVYTRQDTPDNTVTPSFDLLVRTCHAPRL